MEEKLERERKELQEKYEQEWKMEALKREQQLKGVVIPTVQKNAKQQQQDQPPLFEPKSQFQQSSKQIFVLAAFFIWNLSD